MPDDGLSGAGISPRERLERIEHVLERIEDKLDTKADRLLVEATIARLGVIETDPIWTGRLRLTEELRDTQRRLADIEFKGSNQARKAEEGLEALTGVVDGLRLRIYAASGMVAAAIFLTDIALRKGWI